MQFEFGDYGVNVYLCEKCRPAAGRPPGVAILNGGELYHSALAAASERPSPRVRDSPFVEFQTAGRNPHSLGRASWVSLYAMPPLSDETQAAIERLFPPEEREEAARLLASYGERPFQKEIERVRGCLLQISHGEIARLRKYIDDDYRNLIVWADIDRKRHGPLL